MDSETSLWVIGVWVGVAALIAAYAVWPGVKAKRRSDAHIMGGNVGVPTSGAGSDMGGGTGTGGGGVGGSN